MASLRPNPIPLTLRLSIPPLQDLIVNRVCNWRWEYLFAPDGMNKLVERLQIHNETKRRAMLDAAISRAQARHKFEYHAGADALANEADDIGIEPTMTPEEGDKVLWDRHEEWYMSPTLAGAIPSVTIQENGRLADAVNELEGQFGRLKSREEFRTDSDVIDEQNQNAPQTQTISTPEIAVAGVSDTAERPPEDATTLLSVQAAPARNNDQIGTTGLNLPRVIFTVRHFLDARKRHVNLLAGSHGYNEALGLSNLMTKCGEAMQVIGQRGMGNDEAELVLDMFRFNLLTLTVPPLGNHDATLVDVERALAALVNIVAGLTNAPRDYGQPDYETIREHHTAIRRTERGPALTQQEVQILLRHIGSARRSDDQRTKSLPERPEGEESSVEPVLSNDEQYLLIASLELAAANSDSRRTAQALSDRAKGRHADVGNVKKALRRLVEKELLESTKGSGGGYWLTAKGKLLCSD